MKFNCGLTRKEKEQVLLDEAEKEADQWLPWFAWHPVRIGKKDCRWLETVERKRTYPFTWHSLFSVHLTWAFTNYREVQQ